MKSVLFTGSSGFIGRNIIPLLKSKGFLVQTLDIINSDYCCDISKDIPRFRRAYDIVIHAAGKAHATPENHNEEKSFFDVNFEGTKNLCQGLINSWLPESFIFLSTVAVYGLESGEDVTEDFPLNGVTPYSRSKIQAEKFLEEWCYNNGVILGIIRPSLVAGPNPPGNLGSMIEGIKKGRYLNIAGGKARKSVLMVDDIATLAILMASKGGIYNACDNEHPSFSDLESLIAGQLGQSLPISIPYWFAKLLALVGDFFWVRGPFNSVKLEKIIRSLTFSNDKARRELEWEPMNVIDNFMIE